MHLTALWIYPIKSLGGISLSQVNVEGRGFEWDRRWMLIDENQRFLSQRECPEMGLLRVAMTDSHLVVISKKGSINIPLPPYERPQIEVKIWRSLCQAQVMDESINHWFSEVLGRTCKLVFMPYATRREVNPEVAPNHIVSFADGYPYLLASENSLIDLNFKLETPVQMIRFRPNLVVAGALPFDEYNWDTLTIGDVKFKSTKPCERCQIVNLDPRTALAGKEPLKTLANYPQHQNGVWFGINLIAESLGEIRLGQRIEMSPKSQEVQE